MAIRKHPTKENHWQIIISNGRGRKQKVYTFRGTQAEAKRRESFIKNGICDTVDNNDFLKSLAEAQYNRENPPFVYFVQQGINGPVKIGYTNKEVSKRLFHLQVGSPYPLRVLAILDRANLATEQHIHSLFGKDRLCGEWFFPSKELLEYTYKIQNASIKDQLERIYTEYLGLLIRLPDEDKEIALTALQSNNINDFRELINGIDQREGNSTGDLE